MTLKTPHGEFQNDWHFGFYKDMPLAKAKVEVEVKVVGEGWKVVLFADKPAFFVWANVRGMRGEFDDNAFTLLPGRPRTLSFTSKDGEVSLDDFIKSLKASHLSGLCSDRK
jgi:beta-mannosidase